MLACGNVRGYYGFQECICLICHVHDITQFWVLCTSKPCSCSDQRHLADACMYTCRITGKLTNPHLVRDSIVTYLRSSGASEREFEALATYMTHMTGWYIALAIRTHFSCKVLSIPAKSLPAMCAHAWGAPQALSTLA